VDSQNRLQKDMQADKPSDGQQAGENEGRLKTDRRNPDRKTHKANLKQT
jgi:hypothetical protein